MTTYGSDEVATELAKWLRKPSLNWWFVANVSVGIAAFIAAIVIPIWWLLFIPLLAFVECSALYFGRVFAKALQDKDAEIERLRRTVGAV